MKRVIHYWQLATLLSYILIVGCQTAPADYVAADRLNYADVATKYLAYVEADSMLTLEEKQAERDSIALWRMRLDAGEVEAVDPFAR